MPSLDVELLDAAFARYRFRRHTHDAFAIAYVTEGRGSMECNAIRHELAPDTVVMINPGEVHDGGPTPGERLVYRNLYIGPETLVDLARQVWDRVPEGLEFHRTVVQSPTDARRLAELTAALVHGGSRLTVDTALVTALAPILLEHARESGTPYVPPAKGRRPGPGLARVREALHAAPATDYSLPELSQIAQLSAYHLVRSFHDAYGLPPAAYQRDLRLRQARRRLHGEVSIATVAAECGFCDQAHLGRWFKRTYGVTPAAYRRAVHRSARLTTIVPLSPPG